MTFIEVESRPRLPSSWLRTYTFTNGRESAIETQIRPDSFSYGQTLNMADVQVHHMVEHHPIRLAEITLVFQVTHPTMYHENRLHERIRAHHLYAMGSSSPKPMTLFLAPEFRLFDGYIEQVHRGEKRHQAGFPNTYNMKLITKDPGVSSTLEGADTPFLPTAETVRNFGDDWYDWSPDPVPLTGDSLSGFITLP